MNTFLTLRWHSLRVDGSASINGALTRRSQHRPGRAASGRGQIEVHGINGTRPAVHVLVGNIDQRHAEITGSGVALLPPERTHWGACWFVARDPDETLIAFEQKDAG